MSIKLFIKQFIPSKLRSRLKKNRRRIKNSLKKGIEKTTLDDVYKLLVNEFSITKGDNIIISSSFGNLNADFSPTELINLIQNIITEEGNIVMPFYPPGNSYEWAESNQVFDMENTRSSMGVLTQVFSEMPNVYKSIHPTKAVVAWGENAEEIVNGHENSKTPFYWDSPYGWLLKNKSKSLGLGLKNIPIFHSFEDIILEDLLSLYQGKKYDLCVKLLNGEYKNITTLVHDKIIIDKLEDAGDYVRNLLVNSYKRIDFGYTFCYIVDNNELFNRCKIEFLNNNFRYKK